LKSRILRHGELAFTAMEQGHGTSALLLHGFPDHARTFRLQLPALAEAGFHAIAPMMRGYEPSSQPAKADYRLSSLATDIIAFIDGLGTGKVHLIGHDWGAVVSYLVAAMAPEKLHSLTTMAIPHPGRFVRESWRRRPGQLLNSWYMFFFQLRGLADYVLERRDWAFLEWLWRRWSPGWELPQHELEAIKVTFGQPGVKTAALSYYRAMLSPSKLEDTRSTLKHFKAKIRVPTLALTGARDGCMDTRLHDDLMVATDFPAGLTVARIEGAGHFLHQESAHEVNRFLLKHLQAPRISC